MWYRFPMDVVNTDLIDSYKIMGKDVPSSEYEESWIDIRLDAIIAIRPFVDKENSLEVVTGTILFTTDGDAHVVNVYPEQVQKILNYIPEKVKSNK